jgi:hypothetical protein
MGNRESGIGHRASGIGNREWLLVSDFSNSQLPITNALRKPMTNAL